MTLLGLLYGLFPHGFASQRAHPRGFLGRRVGRMLRSHNRECNEWTLSLLGIQPSDVVLEVGFGPGDALHAAAALASKGRVVGVEISRAMIREASRRNASAIAAGRVELRRGDVRSQGFADGVFDKVFAINVLYFLSDPGSTLAELHRVMKPGGRIAVLVGDREELAKQRFTQTGVFALYTGDELVELLQRTGFGSPQYQTRRTQAGTAACALAEKPELERSGSRVATALG